MLVMKTQIRYETRQVGIPETYLWYLLLPFIIIYVYTQSAQKYINIKYLCESWRTVLNKIWKHNISPSEYLLCLLPAGWVLNLLEIKWDTPRSL